MRYSSMEGACLGALRERGGESELRQALEQADREVRPFAAITS